MNAERTLTQPIAGVLSAREPKARGQSAAAGVSGIRAEEFDGLVREHQQRIYRVVLSLTRDPDAADTLTQECFLRAYQKRATFRGEASVGTWLVRIAVNLARDHARNRKRAFWARLMGGQRREEDGLTAAALEVADPAATPEQLAAAHEELATVWAAAEELAPQQRTIFLLRFAQEMSLAEIAETLELEVGTVKAHLFRAVGAVRNRFATEAQRAQAVRHGRHKRLT
jgi:RNA polymerase sigma-70 factor (ECF subfamily)